MSILHDREKASETQFQKDQEREQSLIYGRNRLFAQWVVEQMQLSGDAAEKMMQSIFLSDLQEPGDDDILTAAQQAMGSGGNIVDKETLTLRLELCLNEARKQTAKAQK